MTRYESYRMVRAFHFNSSLANMIQGLQYLTLFPTRVGLLIGICNGLGHLCSSWPQLWLKLIRNGYFTYPQIMFIWAGLAFASFFIGLFVYPWHNVPNNYAEIEEKGIDTLHRDEFIYTCFENKSPKSITFGWVLIIWFKYPDSRHSFEFSIKPAKQRGGFTEKRRRRFASDTI